MTKQFLPLTPKIVLAVVAHPDDIEFCLGGSVAAWVAAGASVHYLILTNGQNGTADRSVSPEQITATRQAEQQAAASALGVKSVQFGMSNDGALANSPEICRDIVRVIRNIKPDVVVAFDPTMIYSADHDTINHPDHRAAGQATLDAVYPFARDHLAFPELVAEGLEPHNTATVLLINYNKQNFFIDITDTFGAKLEAIAAHTSQMPDMARIEHVLRNMAEAAGKQNATHYAEGFMRVDIA